MEKLSVVIITFNEEDNIRRCIDSVGSVADEVVILDSLSTDKTVAIAGEMGAVIYQQAFAGYTAQKNKALDLASFPLVLSLDADEVIDERLAASIRDVKAGARAAGYTMNRCTNYCGKFIRHGSWYPDRKLRLFDKNKARWAGLNIHENVELLEPGKTEHLEGDILHYSYNALEEHITQNNKFSTLSAEAYMAEGKKAGWGKMLFNPAWAFFQGYVLRAGFLDGFHGLVIAANVAHLTFMKYYKLYALNKGIPVKPS
ncbi:glycosyltransferase family 2 protein [Dinghuibacter silviterrae]|uniref:Glycosyltransferase involved in cell wall biosynthesis n=1 Tax=Dinghuibacter silviterrae TaxID=1539049 RepID=A0A4R8DP44_9BACT|nr:glycosyltransferase family 2 protein [Dinghuibacter silviterrae]TDW99841.1 glycosyltransferase involved in cell wall biosynthesis [Dinghuibacter silviterrae]